jgi:ATP adenylyltransferase
MGKTVIKTRAEAGGRFAGLFAGTANERPSYDQPIFETTDCVVVPTLGSILPGWLLVVPCRPAGNFREWSESKHRDATKVIDEVLDGLKVAPERVIWFEHGPSASGSVVGCGIDYAHIHILVDPPFSFDKFVSSVFAASALPWRTSAVIEAYRSIDTGSSYFIAGSEHRAVIAEQVESAGSQFFRRVIAQLADKPAQWNYNDYPHLNNVQATISAFAFQSALTAVS